MFWDDSFCRNIESENNFGCYTEVQNVTTASKSECQHSQCYFYRWEGTFRLSFKSDESGVINIFTFGRP